MSIAFVRICYHSIVRCSGVRLCGDATERGIAGPSMRTSPRTARPLGGRFYRRPRLGHRSDAFHNPGAWGGAPVDRCCSFAIWPSPGFAPHNPRSRVYGRLAPAWHTGFEKLGLQVIYLGPILAVCSVKGRELAPALKHAFSKPGTISWRYLPSWLIHKLCE